MKKSALFLLILGLLIAFFGMRREESAFHSSKLMTSLPESISFANHRSPASARSEQHTLSRNAVLPDSPCWKKIDSQYTSHDFLSRNQTYWDDLIGGWYFSVNEEGTHRIETSLPGMFFLALAKAGLLDGRKIEGDDQQALALLQRVSEEDPKNAAPLLFSAVLESRNGNSARAEELFEQAKDLPHFASYIPEISKAMFQRVRNPADLLQAYSTWTQMPMPSYKEIKNFLKGRNGADRIALQMMSKGLEKDLSLVAFDWVPIEYAIGQGILREAGLKSDHPDYRTLLALYEKSALHNADGIWSKLAEDCDLNALDPLVNELQSHLQ